MKTKFAIYLTLVLVFLQLSVFAQNMGIKEIDNVYLNTPDSVLHFQVSRVKIKDGKLDADKRYYWYKAGLLSSNKGSYAGFLLDGKYCMYDSNRRLREEGYFLKGLKMGVWKRWYANGEYESITIWKNGFKRGRCLFYSSIGVLQKSINYKNDVIDGNVFLYLGSRVEKIKYENGTLVRPKAKFSKKREFIFSKIFKKDTIVQKKAVNVNVTNDSLKGKKNWFFRIFKRAYKKDDQGAETTKYPI